MNRGELPGYYWDQEKKRYFKVQADHLVPEGAKYAKGSVNQERRLAKKRKADERKRLSSDKHFVKRTSVLSAPVASLCLSREQYGFSRSHRAYEQAEMAVVSLWTPKRFEIQLEHSKGRLKDAQYISEMQMMLVASNSSTDPATLLYARDWDWVDASSQAPKPNMPVAVVQGSLTSISTRMSDRGCLVVASGEQSPYGSLFMGLIPEGGADGGVHCAQDVYFTLQGAPDRSNGCQDTTIHPDCELAALIDSTGIYLLDTIHMSVHSRTQPRSAEFERPGCDAGICWLDRNTLLYGAKETDYSVMLWDTRTPSGKTARFTVRDRLTGVFTPSQPASNAYGSPHEILASTNHRINLFDVRMPSSRKHKREVPIFSLPHIHGGPRLQSAARGSIVAAVDRDNIVQVYSLRSGTKAAQLTTPPWQPSKFESPFLRKLMWYDEPGDGPVLQAVRGNGVVRWGWGERGDEAMESDEA